MWAIYHNPFKQNTFRVFAGEEAHIGPPPCLARHLPEVRTTPKPSIRPVSKLKQSLQAVATLGGRLKPETKGPRNLRALSAFDSARALSETAAAAARQT